MNLRLTLISEQITPTQGVISALTLVVQYKTQFQSLESLSKQIKTYIIVRLILLIAFKTYIIVKFSVLYDFIPYVRDGNRSGRPAGRVADRVEILRPAGQAG